MLLPQSGRNGCPKQEGIEFKTTLKSLLKVKLLNLNNNLFTTQHDSHDQNKTQTIFRISSNKSELFL